MSGDLEHAVEMLAADNARFCGIALAADELMIAAQRAVLATGYDKRAALDALQRALDKYKTVRNGQ